MSALNVQQVPPFDCTASIISSMPDSLENPHRLVDVREAVLHGEQPRLQHFALDGVICHASRQIYWERQHSIQDRHGKLLKENYNNFY